METVSGSNNWKIVFRRENGGVTLLQAVTCDKKAALPRELFGLPVTALAHHALAPNRAVPVGEQVQITCGPVTGEWSNAGLEELHLPDTLLRADDYAFYNCGKLKTLYLSDSLCRWGGGALMNCRELNTFHLTCHGQEGEVLRDLGDELPGELDVTLHYADGGTARLILPEYTEIHEENVPHHQFDFHIVGAGYPYHHCFRQGKFNLREYDDLWKGFLCKGHEEDCALRLVWWRLRYPLELSDSAQEEYLTYLRSHVEEAAHWRLQERDAAGLQFLLRETEPTREFLAQLCAEARKYDAPEVLAILLEEQHRRFPAGAEKTFDL